VCDKSKGRKQQFKNAILSRLIQDSMGRVRDDSALELPEACV